ncbi:MAG: hypothetical protein Tsb0034_05670 [Ekhidna sp.]
MSTTGNIDDLMRLARSQHLQEGQFKTFLDELQPQICELLGAASACFWLHEPKKGFVGKHPFFKHPEETTAPSISIDKHKELYQKILKQHLFCVSSGGKAHLSKDTLEFLADFGSKTWIGIQIWNQGKLFGLLSFHWDEEKSLSELEKTVILFSGTMVSQCYGTLLNSRSQEVEAGDETLLEEQTKEKARLVKKLEDHAFFTSHNIRHPLSTIMALTDLIKLSWDDREAYEELLQQLKMETMNLDEAVRVMTAKIELD